MKIVSKECQVTSEGIIFVWVKAPGEWTEKMTAEISKYIVWILNACFTLHLTPFSKKYLIQCKLAIQILKEF